MLVVAGNFGNFIEPIDTKFCKHFNRDSASAYSFLTQIAILDSHGNLVLIHGNRIFFLFVYQY